MSLQEPKSLPLVCTKCSSVGDALESVYSRPTPITTRNEMDIYGWLLEYSVEDGLRSIASICFTDGPPCCQLYNFLIQAGPGAVELKKGWYQIFLVSSIFANSIQKYTKELFDTSALAIVQQDEVQRVWPESKLIYPTSISIPGDKTKAILGRKVPEYLDYGILNNWIKSCQEYHQDTCFVDTGYLSDIPGFRLILCSTGEIVLAPPQAEYVALSYVWGTVTSDLDTNAGTVPATAALVIRDAMIVATNIGYRYLWVDRYCIPQDDEEARHTQIMRMDLIYKSAQLTIISAAGEDGSWGIPGVNTVPRIPQPKIDFPNISLVSCLPSQKYEVDRSIWATRGWTYQEGILSRRCLVFTQYQASFQCGTHYCPCESIDEPKFVRPRFGIDYEWDRRDNNPLPIKIDTKASNIHNCLNEYLRRKLTYESDVLNAVQGILNDFVARKILDSHIWGIPISKNLQLCHSKDNYQPLALAERFAHALCWTNLPPKHRHREYTSIKRRAGFPSWSWVGWVGLVSWRYLSPIRHDLHIEHPCVKPLWAQDHPTTRFHYIRDITIVLKDGSIKRLDEMQIVDSDVNLMPYIFIETWSFNLRFIYEPIEQDFTDDVPKRWKRCPVIPMDLVRWNKSPYESSYDSPQFINYIINSTWTALVIGFTDTLSHLDLLIIENVGDHFERAGILRSVEQNGEYNVSFRDILMERRTFKLG